MLRSNSSNSGERKYASSSARLIQVPCLARWGVSVVFSPGVCFFSLLFKGVPFRVALVHQLGAESQVLRLMVCCQTLMMRMLLMSFC